LKEKFIEVSKSFPAEFREQRNGFLMLQFVVERRVFLSKKKLTYKCRVRISDEKKEETFFDMLNESKVGLSVGSGLSLKKKLMGLREKSAKAE